MIRECVACRRLITHPDHSTTRSMLSEKHQTALQRMLCGDCPIEGPWEDCPS